jgi:cytochrome c553
MPALRLGLGILLVSLSVNFNSANAEEGAAERLFEDRIAPLLTARCVRCHQGDETQGDVRLTQADQVIDGQGDGWLVVPGKPAESYLLDVISGAEPSMPKSGEPLTAAEVEAVRNWIAAGAPWPKDRTLRDDPLDWWSLRPLTRPELPELSASDEAWARNPIDRFIIAKLREKTLAPSPEADRRTLIRRLSFDLVGLPPTPERIEEFVNDSDPAAYERLVDELLASPHHGERWARHWLDVVHYGDTHGFDKDKVRPHAWPYRDYVIRSLNEDKPYHRFVREQIAGDHFSPMSADGVVAMGFLAAGPFDFVGQIEVRDGTLEKRRVRNLDRDDMVATTMNTFVSLTVQCARCHNHKFDPIQQEEYYRLQAVFAGIDRADRPYEVSPDVSSQRRDLAKRVQELQEWIQTEEAVIQQKAGPRLETIAARLAELRGQTPPDAQPEFGYHSQIANARDTTKWVQLDLGSIQAIDRILYVGCHDTFAGIGAGFGFPLRYKLEISNDPKFREGVTVVEDQTQADVVNPGVEPRLCSVAGQHARYLRFTATKLAERKGDYIFALAEIAVHSPDGRNLASQALVTSLDSIEAPVRWRMTNLVDGYSYRWSTEVVRQEFADLTREYEHLIESATDTATRERLAARRKQLADAKNALASLPAQQQVYAAATHFEARGQFTPTLGKPRPVHLLARGNEAQPVGEPLAPGTLSCLPNLAHDFSSTVLESESARRAALAEWIANTRNPLTWRSIVNRMWHYHFGRGIAATTSDFGRMGTPPTHPELLNWLAVEFRDSGQSLKALHRLIVTSATYRQASTHDEAKSTRDASNLYLWRFNRRRLEAEAIRDSILMVSGRLDRTMGGPGFRTFGFEDDHSPRYKYHEYDPSDWATHRRSIYRFVVRSVPDPLMTALDCADPSQAVPERNETLTALQALSLLNNKFTVAMAESMASRIRSESQALEDQLDRAFRLALGRGPSPEELSSLVTLAEEHGMPSVCRVLFNMNEFLFVD